MKNIRAEGIKQKNPTIVWIVGLSVSLSHLSDSGKNPLHSDSCVYPHLALSILVIRNSDSKIPCAAVWQVSWLTVLTHIAAFPISQWHNKQHTPVYSDEIAQVFHLFPYSPPCGDTSCFLFYFKYSFLTVR